MPAAIQIFSLDHVLGDKMDSNISKGKIPLGVLFQ